MAITIPEQYGYVLLAAATTALVNVVHSSLTSRARKAANVAYPTTYVSEEVAAKDPKAYRFNCAQRAHANFTETLPSTLVGLTITGLRYPVFAGALGGIFAVGRLVFAFGYVRGGPEGRLYGAFPSGLSQYTLILASLYSAVKFILE